MMALNHLDIEDAVNDIKRRLPLTFKSPLPPEGLIKKLHQWAEDWKLTNYDEYEPKGFHSRPENSSSYSFGGSFDCFLSLVAFAYKQGELADHPLPSGYSFKELAHAAIIIQVSDQTSDRRAMEKTRYFLEEFEKHNIKKEFVSNTNRKAAKAKRAVEIDVYLTWAITRYKTRSPSQIWQQMLNDMNNDDQAIRRVFDEFEPDERVFIMKKSYRSGAKAGDPMTFGYSALKKRLANQGHLTG